MTSSRFNGWLSKSSESDRTLFNRPLTSGESQQVAIADLSTFPVPPSFTSSNSNLPIHRPRTSHAHLQPVGQSEPPRIPHAVNRTPPVAIIENYDGGPEPSRCRSAAPSSRELSSYSSFASLRSQTSDDSAQKKRKRRFPFKAKFIGAWKEGVSKPGRPQDQEPVETCDATEKFAQLPVNIKSAAAKRLGIGFQDRNCASSNPQDFVVRTSSSSVVHSHIASQSVGSDDLVSNQPSLDYARQLVPNGVKSPITDQHQPEHPLETEARQKVTRTTNYLTQEAEPTTFYASSSDSEDDDQYSSAYSCGSSHTSYNISSPTFTDIRRARDQSNRTSPAWDRSPRKDIFAAYPSHQHRISTSSSISHRASSTTTPTSRPTSFSRPFARPTSHQMSPHSPSTSTASRINDIDSQAPLAAIREDSPFQGSESSADVPLPLNVRKVPQNTQIVEPAADLNAAKSASPSTKQSSSELDHVLAQRCIKANREMSQLKVESQSVMSKLLCIPATDKKSARPLSLAVTKQSEAFISAESAEAVILHIFETVDNFKDLFACARLNKGFYKIFKRHELGLMKNTLRNFSPAQWELREASPKEIVPSPQGPAADYTPTSYVQFHKRDGFVLSALKSMVLSRCQAFLRFETVVALGERNPARSTRIDDAFWRIWTFCTIFGSDTGREHDTVSQMDWLRGGAVAHRPTSPFSAAGGGDGESSATLTGAGGSFGRGNYGGLTAEELYDMTEIWNCIKSLLEGILGVGRCAQARKYGVFDGHEIGGGDAKDEEAALEEWVHYLATLGPTIIVDLANHTNSTTDQVFDIAKSMEWTTWRAPDQGLSRSTFLRDVVTRLHEERVGRATQVTFEQIQAKRRSRGHELAAELREEKERSVRLGDPFAQHHDQSIGVWLGWMAKMEGIKAGRLEEGEEIWANEEVEEKGAKREATGSAEDAARRPCRQRRTNSSLSLFPTAYTRQTPAATPKMSATSTPTRSRSSSRTNLALWPAATAQELRQTGIQDWTKAERDGCGGQQQKGQFFTPRLSTICQET